ncbi:MAG: hypothetical protein QXG17_02555 [Sulfolobales archaeon]
MERWRCNKRVLSRVRAPHRKARNIIPGLSEKFTKELVLKARKRRYAIAVEDLTY